MNKDSIYEEYGDFIFRYLVTLTKNSQAAEELTQETFYQAIKSIDHFQHDGKAKFSTWLCAIAKHVWLQEINHAKHKHEAMTSLSSEIPATYNVEDQYFKNEAKLNFYKRAQKLNEVKREVLYLRILGGLSFKEIGDVLGKSENWARVVFYRTKQEMKKGGELDES